MCWDDDHIKLSRNRVGIEIGIGKYHIKMKKKIQTIFKILGVIGQFVGVESLWEHDIIRRETCAASMPLEPSHAKSPLSSFYNSLNSYGRTGKQTGGHNPIDLAGDP